MNICQLLGNSLFRMFLVSLIVFSKTEFLLATKSQTNGLLSIVKSRKTLYSLGLYLYFVLVLFMLQCFNVHTPSKHTSLQKLYHWIDNIVQWFSSKKRKLKIISEKYYIISLGPELWTVLIPKFIWACNF